MSAVFEWPHVVTAAESDELGHANNEAYVHWMNTAAVAHSAALGWPVEAYFHQGHGWVVRRHEIEYLRPVLPGAQIIVRTWVFTLERATSWRCYAILSPPDSIVLARARTLWAYINFSTGRLTRIPPEVAGAFPILAENVFATPAPPSPAS